MADGSGGTHAGLLAGLDGPIRVLGIDVGAPPPHDRRGPAQGVAPATAQLVLATRASSVGPVEAAVNSARNLRENLRDFSTLFSLWSRLLDRNG